MNEPETEQSTQPELGYGQHTRRAYIIGTVVFLLAGIVVGQFVLPVEWPMWRQLAAGAVMGLWCGFCIFMWRFLFFGDAEEPPKGDWGAARDEEPNG